MAEKKSWRDLAREEGCLCVIAWTAGDVKSIRPRWSMKKCEEQLLANRKWLEERLIEVGWDVLDTLIDSK